MRMSSYIICYSRSRKGWFKQHKLAHLGLNRHWRLSRSGSFTINDFVKRSSVYTSYFIRYTLHSLIAEQDGINAQGIPIHIGSQQKLRPKICQITFDPFLWSVMLLFEASHKFEAVTIRYIRIMNSIYVFGINKFRHLVTIRITLEQRHRISDVRDLGTLDNLLQSFLVNTWDFKLCTDYWAKLLW